MQKAICRTVELPDGKKVKISDAPESWWTKHGATGYLSPHVMAPDPKQPRREMSRFKLDELYESIRAKGVRQPLVLTPRTAAPWVKLDKQYQSAFFIDVSGHRRQTCATRADLPAVPVEIRIYQNEDEHRTDAALLNVGHEDLDEIEEGYEFVRLKREGKSVEQIRESWGLTTVQQVYARMNLTNLYSDLQKMLSSKNGKREFSVSVASIIGGIKTPTVEELDTFAKNMRAHVDPIQVTGFQSFDELTDRERDFALQKLLVAVIQKRNLNSARATDFVRDRTLVFKGKSGHHQPRPERHQPKHRRDTLLNLFKGVTGSVINDWNAAEFQRIFANMTQGDVDAVLKQHKAATAELARIGSELAEIRKSKRPISPEVLRLMERNKVPAVG